MFYTTFVPEKATGQSQLYGSTHINFSNDPGNQFLQKYTLVLYFSSTFVGITSKTVSGLKTLAKCIKHIMDTGMKAKIYAVQALQKQLGKIIDSCAILLVGKATPPVFDVHTCTNMLLLMYHNSTRSFSALH